MMGEPPSERSREAGESRPLLLVEEISLAFGGVQALSDVNMAVETGSIVGLVGPNGAGKTSLFNCICGYYRPTAGAIWRGDTDVTHRSPHELIRLGVSRTFQHPVLEPDKTVLENVLVGGHVLFGDGPLGYALRLPGTRRRERQLVERALALLDSLGVAPIAGTLAGSLSYGGQKRVELARALLSGPELLLLDELASGLTHEEVMELGQQIRDVRDTHQVGVVLVEHHMGMISSISDKVVVLVQGKKIVEGTAAEVSMHPVVVEAYLGGAA